MPYTFTVPEQISIQNAYDLGPQQIGDSGNFETFYTTVADILNDADGHGGTAPGDLPDVIKSRIWVEGALNVNIDKGSFATIIREYAIKQGHLHYDRTFSATEMQEASNEVARKFMISLRDDNGWTVPDIDEIATKDLTGVSEILFNVDQSDSVFENNTAWPGTLLLSKLRNQADFTGNLIAKGNLSEADNLDDWRNVTYANHSYNYAASEALIGTGYELIDITGFNLTGDLGTVWELFWLPGDGKLPLTVGSAVQGLAAEDAFEPAISYGEISIVHMLDGSGHGTFVNPQFNTVEDYFQHQVRSFFGGPGTHNQSIAATVHRVDELVAGAQNNDLASQDALQALSIFKVGVSATSNSVLSDQYWFDRGQMTKARLAYDAEFNLFGTLQNTGGALQSFTFTKPIKFTDLKTNVIFRLAPSGNANVFTEVTFGTTDADTLVGNTEDDSLYGLNGTDSLNGGLGDDHLFGGAGSDIYIIDEGRDIIEDTDGSGSIFLNGETLLGGNRVGGQVWESTNGRFRYQLLNTFQGSQLVVIDSTDTDGMVVVNHFSDGDLGINLTDSSDPLPPIDTIAPADTAAVGTLDNYTTGSSGNDLYDAGNLYDNVSDFQGGDDVVLLGSDDGFSDRVSTAGGNDTIYGEEGKDYILAGQGFGTGDNDKDTVVGGADIDLINTGVGDDLIIAGEEGEDINATNTSDQGDWIVADEGNDVAYGTGNQDFITMGNGADLVYAGGGFDVILADGFYRFNSAASVITPVPFGAREHSYNGSSWDTTSVNSALLTPGSAFDFTTSINGGGDFVFTPQASLPNDDRVQDEVSDSNDDTVFAGPGPDWISGGSGSDVLYGEGDDDLIYGDDLVAMPVGSVYGNDILFGGSGQDMLFGNQGNDDLYGGADDDTLYGDDSGEPSGNDNLYGGDGVDELHGLGGDDYLSGGAGDETVLMGGDGNDVIDGDAGNDILTGGAGDDNLRGGTGDDTLNAGDDNDVLDGGMGDDVLNGEAGNDIMYSSPGLDQLNGGADDDVYLAVLASSPIDTPDVITDTSGNDRIVFDELVFANRIEFTDQGSDLLVKYSPNDALLITGAAGGGVIEEYEFSDGRILSYGDLNSFAKVLNGSSNDITAFNDWYEGDNLVQNLDLLDGNDAAIGRGGDDILTGNLGNDTLDGGADNDILNGNAGDDRLFGGSGDDELNGGDDNDLLAAGDGSDTLNGGNGIDMLRGGNGDDILNGEDGDDYIQGDRGADALKGGLGSDVYLFKYQDDPEPGVMPRTTIVDTDDAGGNAIKFLGGLDADDITLINDLDTGDLEIQYGHHENTILSSIYITNSAEGEVITEFQFDDGSSYTFEELCLTQPVTCEVDDLIFENGFEQGQLFSQKSVPSYSDALLAGMGEHAEVSPLSGLMLVATLLLQKVFY